MMMQGRVFVVAILHLNHAVQEIDIGVQRPIDDEAAAESQAMKLQDAAPYILCGDGPADESIWRCCIEEEVWLRNTPNAEKTLHRALMSSQDASAPILLLHPEYILCARHVLPRLPDQ